MFSSKSSTGRTATGLRRLLVVTASAISLFAAVAGPASAGGDQRFPLHLIGGEDPGAIAGRTEADVRADGKILNVNMDNLDPARFPAGCYADVSVGAASGRAVLVNQADNFPLGVTAATSLDFFTPGKPEGQLVTVGISCATINAAGLSETHSTLWQGTAGKPKAVKYAEPRAYGKRSTGSVCEKTEPVCQLRPSTSPKAVMNHPSPSSERTAGRRLLAARLLSPHQRDVHALP